MTDAKKLVLVVIDALKPSMLERVYVEIAPVSLENLFLQLTGKELRD